MQVDQHTERGAGASETANRANIACITGRSNGSTNV